MWGSGRIVTRDFPLSGFTSIRAAAFDIEILQADKYGVTVRADDNVIDRLIVRRSGSTLVLGKRPWFWNIGPFTLEATITMPTLEALDLSGGARAELDLEKMAVVTASVALSGASRARLNVTSEIESIEASGASTLRYLGDPTLGHIDSSGASRIVRV